MPASTIPALVIFDFDGTLADSFDFFLSAQRTLAQRHKFRAAKPHEVEAARRLSTRELLKASGLSRWRIPFVAADCIKLMRAAPPMPLFSGMIDALDTLHTQGLQLAVVSSNSVENIERALGPQLTGCFAVIEGGAHLLGKQRMLRKVLRATGHASHQALYVGDQLADWQAAQRAGIPFAAVAWGYADPVVFAGLPNTKLIANVQDLRLLADTHACQQPGTSDIADR